MRSKNSGPFLRGKRGIYYCWVDGHLKSLRTDKPRVAEARYGQLLKDWERQREEARKRAEEAAKPPEPTVRECFDAYLERAARLTPNSQRNRKAVLDAFACEVGALKWHELTADALERWTEGKGWSPSYRRSAINHVVAAFNHCVKKRNLPRNPVANVEKPRWERRKATIAPEDERRVYEASRGPLRAILTVLRSTGARPSELCRATVDDYRDGVIVLREHKSDETGRDRIIYLTDEARSVVESLARHRQPGEPIFLNSRGRPWTPDTLYCRFKRLRKTLGLGEGVFPYALRHKFTSDAINAGNANPALVAKALGHADLNMLLRHYLREDPEAVRKALEAVTRKT